MDTCLTGFYQRIVMPAKKGFCWCLGGTAPPEISYGLENGGMTLKPIEVDLPMPEDEKELNAKFEELVDELGLDKPHREAMYGLPPEKKWQIYCSKRKEHGDTNYSMYPDYYIERVNMMMCMFFCKDEDEIKNRTALVESLKTALRTQPMSFVMRFIELDGLNCLLKFLTSMDYSMSQSPIHTAVIGCIKALLNNSQGRAHMLAHPMSLNNIAQSLSCDNVRTKIAVLEILGAVCLIPGGHKKVLEAMYHYQKHTGERTRFQSLINDLDKNTGEYREEVNLYTTIMSFINAILCGGAGKNHLEFRLHLRYEFLMLGIQPILEKLRKHDNATLDRHLDVFEMLRNEDERQLSKRFDISHMDTRSATAMFDVLRKKLSYTSAYCNLQSMLLHLLQLPFGNGVAIQYWQLIDRIIQQICLQTKEGDPDIAPVELDVKKVVKQLANENAMKEVHQKIREIQKENDDLASRLAKKEHECEVKSEEQEELMQTLQKIKTKLEKETNGHNDTKIQLAELQTKLNELQQLVDWERGERSKLEHAVKTGSLPDDAKMGVANMSAAMDAKVHLGMSNGLTPHIAMTNMSMPPPPPPPPPMGPPAPPPPPCGAPPPPGGGSLLDNSSRVRKKNTPQSKQPLKSFNWSKLPENKAKETIWKDIDDSLMYRHLDLEDFEKTFSAYQRHDSSDNDIFNKSTKSRELSVIDGRRAQNCTILLSKLKMTNQELSDAILSMDKAEEIPKDMCEQLVKFVPTAEEAQMLGEHEHEIDQMARADRFLYEMSKIDHYEQRLKALFYKKKFSERMSDAKPKVEAVLDASEQITKSRRLRKLLEVVLAFGNYMNRGQRGNASGFRINSLNKIIDTKSSIDKKVTLLHYLATVIEKRFPELLKLEHEIKAARQAAKVNMSELESELGIMRVGLKDIEKELKYQRSRTKPVQKGDRFINVMADFMAVSAYNFSDLEDLVIEMKQKFSQVIMLFGEEKSQPEEFFGTFDNFLTAFHDVRIDNERFKKMREEEEKRSTMESQLKLEREKQKNRLGINKKGQKDEGEFDDLISALKTGDVFGEDMAKLKRTRRRPSQQTQKGSMENPRERAIKVS